MRVNLCELERTVLELLGLRRSAYHGGDYEGNQLRILMRNAQEIMTKTQIFLLNIPLARRHKKCTDEMIVQVCNAYRQLFKYYNIMRYYARKADGTATDSDIYNLKNCVNKAMMLAKSMFDQLPPKMHAVAKHLQEDFEEYLGIGLFTEDFGEQDHQQGKKDEQMTKGMGDRTKAFATMSTYSERRNLAKSSGIEKNMLEETSRSKRKISPEGDDRTDAERMESYIAEVLGRPEMEFRLGSVNNIIKVNRRMEETDGEQE